MAVSVQVLFCHPVIAIGTLINAGVRSEILQMVWLNVDVNGSWMLLCQWQLDVVGCCPCIVDNGTHQMHLAVQQNQS